ncbi:MAG TPA: ComF family protein [Candidatus Cloacimonadota bacterium]|nr:ComF family protein [Candidatus Cloacimonadota bacterium]
MKALLDLLYPPTCLVCRKRLEQAEDRLCPDCRSQISRPEGEHCRKCGSPVKGSYCEACADFHYSFKLCRSAYQYGDVVKQLVHALKYEELLGAGDILAEGMQEYCSTHKSFEDYDAVIPVPLHRVRKRERGYNQSEHLARKLASRLGIPCSNAVTRPHYTSSQTRLGRTERSKNLSGAFRVRNPKSIRDKKIILVDDVFTTGSTVNEISKLLLDNGAKQVAVMTAARA